MDQQDISGYGGFSAPDPNAFNIGPTDGVQQTEGAQAPAGSGQSISSISKSELEALVMMLAAGIPVLQFPNVIVTNFNELSQNGGVAGVAAKGTAYQQIALLVEETKHDIITSMWDKYIEDIRDAADRAKQDDIKRWTTEVAKNGPKSGSEYLAYILALSANRRAEELGDGGQSGLAVQFNQAFNYWLVDPIQSKDTAVGGVGGVDKSLKDGYPDSSFITGCVVCGSDSIRGVIGAIGAAAAAADLSLSPVSDAFLAVGPNTALPMDSQAAAAMIAALLNGGAVMKANAKTIEDAAAKGQPPRDLDFAKNYAKQILTIVTHEPKGGEPLDKQQQGQNGMIKLMLSAMALNMVYRAAYGGMSGEEFASLLKGDTAKLPPQIKDLIESLLDQIKAYLPDDPEKRSSLVVSLMEYVDSKDSVDNMLQTTRMFTAALSTSDIDQRRLLAKGN